MRLSSCSWIAGFATLGALSAIADGIPEPSLILYGAVWTSTDGSRLTVGTIEWTFEPIGGGPSVTASASLQNINDQFSYALRVPCETPLPGRAPSPQTLSLVSPPRTYTRANVRINGEPAQIQPPGSQSLTLGDMDRGRLERIDLRIARAALDSDGNGLPDAWEQAFFNQIGIDPAGDPDLDGMNNRAEWKAGTDPNNFQSQFAVLDVEAKAGGAVAIAWSSTIGRTYAVLRSSQVISGYALLQAGIAATPPLNLFEDLTASAGNVFFYLIQVED
jgi:hypothetical protein